MNAVFRLWFCKDEYAQHSELWVEVLLSVLQASLPTALQDFCHRLGKAHFK